MILGAFLVAWLPERFRGLEDYRILVFGAALVLMMALRPQGLLPSRIRRAEMAGTDEPPPPPPTADTEPSTAAATPEREAGR